MAELAEKEQFWAEELEWLRNENEQKLKGKLRRREIAKQRKGAELDKKHRLEQLYKELELMEIEDQRWYEIEIAWILEVIEKQKNNKKMPLLVYQLLDELVKRRIED